MRLDTSRSTGFNLCACVSPGSARGSGLPVPQEPALLTSEAMDGGAQSASSEWSPGWAERTSGDGAWAAPSQVQTREGTQVDNLCYERARASCTCAVPS